jgi:peptidoglycan/xylan/chitin deacetylase (PgdA/CDA1 family)
MDMFGLGRLNKCRKKIINKFYNKAIILAYHRVAAIDSDPQLLCVSPQNFEEHMKLFLDKYRILSLNDLNQAIKNKKIPNKSIVITFDDGYVDNFLNAIPILNKLKIAATIFVTTGYVDKDEELWWDELERIFLLSSFLPNKLSLNLMGKNYSWIIKDNKSENFDASWNVCKKTRPDSRFFAYCDLHKLIRPLSVERRLDVLNFLKDWSGAEDLGRDIYRVVKTDELKSIKNNYLIDIGSHTVNHCVLSTQDLACKKNEIVQSKKDLEMILGRQINNFSYPFGGKMDFDQHDIEFIKEAGYESAVANFSGIIYKNANRYALPRFLIRNWNRDTLENKIELFFNQD